MRDSLQKNALASSIANGLVNLVLLALVIPLTLVSFFSLQDILLTIGAHIIVDTVDSAVRGKYALVTIRNLWLLLGGMLLVAVVIGSLSYFFNHSREPRVRRVFLRILAVEILLIGLSWLVAG